MALFPGFNLLPSYVQNSYGYYSIPANTKGSIFGDKITYTQKGFKEALVYPKNTSMPFGVGSDFDEVDTTMTKPVYSLQNSLAAQPFSFVQSSYPSYMDSAKVDPIQREIDLNKMYLDMDPSDALSLAWKKDPWGVSMGLANGVLNTAGSIWNGIQQYRTSKQALDLATKDYELKKRAYEDNEARNQERFNWLRQARSTSQL